jgi:hypothetical protein
MLNKYMENRQHLQNIYETVKEIGLVKNQYDFSKLCGRTAAWFSCVKTRNQPFTPSAAITLSLTLRMRACDIVEEQRYKQAIELSELLLEGTCESIRIKQIKQLGCPQ